MWGLVRMQNLRNKILLPLIIKKCQWYVYFQHLLIQGPDGSVKVGADEDL